jgi:exopolysaccharide production protein ExoZ
MTPTSGALPRQLEILQVYRGLAATLVVLYHLTWWGGVPIFLQLPYWLPGMPTWKAGGFFLFGHSGVDFFFTLSGFVMVWGYGHDAGKIGRLWGFLKGRFTRIYPTYWAVFFATIAYYAARPGLVDSEVYSSPDGLFRGFWLYGNGPWHVPPAGTLPYELALYGFFALSFIIGPTLFALATLAWCAAILAQYTQWYVFGSYTIAMSPQMLEFFLGALAAVVVRRYRPRISGVWLAVAAVVYLAIGVADSIAVIRGAHDSPLTFALPYALILVLGAGFELKQARRYPRVLMLLGDASFSIYLTHYYLIWEINGKLFQYPAIAGVVGYAGQRWIALVLVLACGVAFWALVERPLVRLLHRGRSKSAARAEPTLAHPAAA